MARRGGGDADVQLLIRARDEGGLRLLASYRAEILKLKNAGKDVNTALRSQLVSENALWAKLRTTVIAYYAARQAGRAIVGFVREGLQFNQILETAQLGIASLITATSKVRDINGNVLQGAKALEGAYGLAADQMNKIRIAGLQTAATTEQLVDAFQQALGPGLKAGLNLDQIRQVTVQIVQAAGAIGLPFNQLNQEVRSILDATIDRNSRVARVLSITNEEVRLAREQGRLAEFLNEKMKAFTVAGGAAAKTMFVLKSNIKEAFQVFAGQATQDLFVKVRDALGSVFEDAFDFKNLRIAEKFQGLVQAIQSVFAGVGDLFVASLNAMVHGAETLAGWFEKNKIQVSLTVSAFIELAKQLGGALADIVSFLGSVVGIGTETNLIALTVKLIADGIRTVRENAGLLLATFIGTKLAVLLLGEGLIGAAKTIQFINKLVLANPWTAVAVVLATILALIIAANEAQSAHNEMVIRTAEALSKRHGDEVADLAKLTRQYRDNAIALEKTTKGTEAYESANDALLDTYDQILKIAPELLEMGGLENKSLKERLGLLKDIVQARLTELAVVSSLATIAAAAAQKDLEAEQAKPIRLGASGLVISNKARIRELQDEANRTQRIANAAFDATVVASKAANQTLQSLNRLDTAPGKTKVKGAANDPSQIRAAAIELAKAEFDARRAVLERDLEIEKITQDQFNKDYIAAINKRVDDEVAAHQRLLAVTTDVGERKKIQADIAAAELQRIQDVANFERDTHKRTIRDNKKDLIEQAKDIRDQLSESKLRVKDASQSINEKIFRGEITKREGAEEFKKILQEEIDKANDLVTALSAIQTKPGSAEEDSIGALIVRIRSHLADLNKAVLDSNKILELFGARFKESVEENLADSLTDIVTRTKSVSEAFREMATSIIRDIAQIINRMIAMAIVEKTIGLFRFGGGGGGERTTGTPFALASGGFVHGSGTSTSDSIPARLSAGEYVVRASAVKQVGLEALDMINYGASGARRRNHTGGYAAGGVVESARGGIASLRVGLDRGLILEAMRSPEGAKIHVEHASRNRNKLRQVSGR